MIKHKPKLVLVLLFFIVFSLKASDRNSVADSAEEISPITVGEKIPTVVLKTIEGEDYNLVNEVSKKPTILVFYRGGWCPYCSSHLSDLYSIEKELLDLGYQIAAVSIDKPEKLKETLDKTKINYTLLSDSDAEASKAFGLAFKVADEYNNKLKDYGISLEEASGRDHHILPVPAAFVINKKGVIKYSYVNPDLTIRVDPQVLLKAAKMSLEES